MSYQGLDALQASGQGMFLICVYVSMWWLQSPQVTWPDDANDRTAGEASPQCALLFISPLTPTFLASWPCPLVFGACSPNSS